MRRSELESHDEVFFTEVALGSEVGYLTLVTAEGYPRAVALNFAAVGTDIFFHGALGGEKFDLVQAGPKAGFTMVKAYSFIPSYFSAPDFACPATHFFKSVEIKGRCTVVEDLEEKTVGLQALMEKHQPEGQYLKIDSTDRRYLKALQGVGVYRVRAESWTGKNKFGQNEPRQLRERFVVKLRDRGGPMDEETAQEILKSLTE